MRSTDIERTLETAMSIMMGMFPPGTRDGHIIPIHTNHYVCIHVIALIQCFRVLKRCIHQQDGIVKD